MKNLDINTRIEICKYEELTADIRSLIDCAKRQVLHSYADYSHFHVGSAALLANGEVFGGSNQENAAYPSGLCAERTTLFYAQAQYPDVPITALAIAAWTDGEYTEEPVSPCGACRQVMIEIENRLKKDMHIYLYGKKAVYHIASAKQLLPFCFVKESLQG
ncbi:MAG TPA: cytidine deaminase [Bacteroidales bacterium]|jgi:cytidine deaminase|nr:cytidine deaminase [Bacteroidales bacterium]